MLTKTAYMVATAHLDTVWRWTIADTVEKFIPDTLSKNLTLLRSTQTIYSTLRVLTDMGLSKNIIQGHLTKSGDMLKQTDGILQVRNTKTAT